MSRFDPTTYPGPRPSGATLLYAGREWPVRLGGTRKAPLNVEPAASGAAVLEDRAVRWSVAYGSTASPGRLFDKGLDVRGAVLLPGLVEGWAPVWEARRTASTGAVPLTLIRSPGTLLELWVLGVVEDDTDLLDASEGRGVNYALGRTSEVAVGSRFVLPAALAYGPTLGTRLLADAGDVCIQPAYDQARVGAMVDAGDPVTVGADPLPACIDEGWPPTPLDDLDLFVYGTLMPGQERWEAIAEHVEVLTQAAVPGTLVSTFYGWPAASFGAGGHVHGVLLRPRGSHAAQALYEIVDRVEDVPSLFRRVTVRAEHGVTRTFAAAYAWNDAQGPAPGTPIRSGRWPDPALA
ncbi:MAG TPA: gamma-glutamylcyclotransferase family protein [Nitriliruptorales bacterium]